MCNVGAAQNAQSAALLRAYRCIGILSHYECTCTAHLHSLKCFFDRNIDKAN